MASPQLKKQIFLQADNDDFIIRIQPTETEQCRWIFANSLSKAFNMAKMKAATAMVSAIKQEREVNIYV